MRNLYDFDKTIYKKDSSLAFYFFCFFRTPKMFFHIFGVMFWAVAFFMKWISAKSFKQRFFSFLGYFENPDEMVEKFWKKEQKNFTNWYKAQKRDDDVICSASPQFLVEQAMKILNPQAVVIATKMDSKTGMIDGENCKGIVKIARLKEAGFESFDACYTDSLSDFPMFDISAGKYLVFGESVQEFSKQKPPFGVKIKYIIKQLRVKHYIKNVLIFIPLFFGGFIIEQPGMLLVSLGGFISFSLLSSCIYIINDLKDVKADRLHTRKRKRPIASYMIKPYEAIITAVVLFALCILVNYWSNGLNWFSFFILMAYLIVNIGYSFGLKNIPIVDVFLLSACYLIRVFFGAAILDIYVSNWLYLTVLCAALFLGLGKRRNGMKTQKAQTRKVNEKYSYEFLDKNLYVSLAMTLIFYSLWTLDFYVPSSVNFNGILLLATIPLVYMILMKYCLIIEMSPSDGDPIEVLLKDWILLLLIFFYLASMFIILYVPIPKIVW